MNVIVQRRHKGPSMIEHISWLDRAFVFDQGPGMFPILLDRLRSTAARATDIVEDESEDLLAARINGNCLVKDHLGHLVDLQIRDERRLNEFLGAAEALSPADVKNRAAEEANHRQKPAAEIIHRLRARHDEFVRKLDVLTEREVNSLAVHPRLNKSIRLLVWIYFVAEHDDHHLARERQVIAT